MKFNIYKHLGRLGFFEDVFAYQDYLIVWEKNNWQILTIFDIQWRPVFSSPQYLFPSFRISSKRPGSIRPTLRAPLSPFPVPLTIFLFRQLRLPNLLSIGRRKHFALLRLAGFFSFSSFFRNSLVNSHWKLRWATWLCFRSIGAPFPSLSPPLSSLHLTLISHSLRIRVLFHTLSYTRPPMFPPPLGKRRRVFQW